MDIYLMGICGTGMGSLAGLLKHLGHRVRGSDENVYPPMSEKLAEWGIEVRSGYNPNNLRPHPDRVVVGNVIRGNNPEAIYVREQGLPTLSMPQALAEFGIGTKHSVVFAGTHGKTSTTAMAAHVAVAAGRDPSFLVGGVLKDYPESFRAGGGDLFLVEGDEYDTAYFDKGPKFLHYRPQTAVITSLEFDHADIFRSVEAVEEAFAALIDAVPTSGHVVVWSGAERARRLLAERSETPRVLLYGIGEEEGVDLQAHDVRIDARGVRFRPVFRGTAWDDVHVPVWGEHGVQNALAVIGALSTVDMGIDAMRAGLGSFGGVRRRLEVVGEARDVVVVDDFGHHPSAVRTTLEGARLRWPRRRVWAVFEPRSATSRRNVFHQAYADAFAGADQVVIASHPRLVEIPAANRFDPDGLASDLRDRDVSARYISDHEKVIDHLVDNTRAGDVVLFFSNGDFSNLPRRVLSALAYAR